MAMLTVDRLAVSFGDVKILEDIQFEVQKGDRIGFVGINGSGKTTLFKTLTGEHEHEAGNISFSKDTTLGYMEQHVPNDMAKTAFEEVLSVFSSFTEIETELERISIALNGNLSEDRRTALIAKQADLNDRFVLDGGLTFRSRTRSAMMGLGFSEEQLLHPVGVLSGGQRAKLQLAKLLLGGANLMLLDEPTNHLDIAAVEWLEAFLIGYGGSFIVVSHDRYFLDKVTTRTFELENRKITAYKGNYSAFLRLREEKRLEMQRIYDAKQKEIKRIEGIIEQQRRWNQERNYVTIASKEKQISRIAADMEKPSGPADQLRFQFQASRRTGDEALQVKGLGLSFNGNQLFANAEFDIRRGEKVFLIGPNGCGKTSLLKILLKQYTPDCGEVKFGAGVELGYYAQSQSGLDDSKQVIEEIWHDHMSMTQTEVRSALAVFLFKGEDVFKPVATLSGGERARLLLLKLMLSRTNFLLLDEPTNHLDIGACEALESALSGYDGTLLVVSHDRYLINQLADKVILLEPDGTRSFEGNYDVYLETVAKEAAASSITDQPMKQQEKQSDYKLKKARDARLRKLRADLAHLEREIEQMDQRLKAAEECLNRPEIAADYTEAMRLTEEIAALSCKAEERMEEWTSISEEIETLRDIDN